MMNTTTELKYDSETDTRVHINIVAQFLLSAAIELANRSQVHDDSKLLSPEKEMFDEWTPKLAACTYGSDEYKSFLAQLKPALDHHYAHNSHHPEHYENGVSGMNLFDVIEMFLDWKAATLRHNDGDIMKSIDINEKRFGIAPQLSQIFRNTVEWVNSPKSNREQIDERSVATKADSSTVDGSKGEITDEQIERIEDLAIDWFEENRYRSDFIADITSFIAGYKAAKGDV